ncbi:MAG: AAA family ATPase [Actinobacteria bacterium]|nr:AAA family ATPase [Actinomycetota bacterium]
MTAIGDRDAARRDDDAQPLGVVRDAEFTAPKRDRHPVSAVRDAEFAGPTLDARPRDPQRTFCRQDVYTDAVIDGRLVPDSARARARAWIFGWLTSRAERDEATLEQRLRAHQRGLTRSNVVAVVSPKGGVGKTTCAFLLGNLLASHVRLRTVVVDANPDHGTLGLLAPDAMRSQLTLSDAIANLDQVSSATELRPYVSVLPSGLHLMGAPADPRIMKTLSPQLYGQLTAFLARFYDVVVLDLGTGLTDPIAEFAIARADQGVVVTTPEWVTASIVLDAMRYIGGEQGNDHLTVVLNKAPVRGDAGDRQRIEAEFRRQQIARRVTVPDDLQLKTMLDSATYTLESLRRASRLPIKELGLAVASQLV